MLLPNTSSFSIAQDLPHSTPNDDYLVDLMAVFDHNVQQMHVTEIPASALSASKITSLGSQPDRAASQNLSQPFSEISSVAMVHGRSFLFKRFNPINIMHVFHDDLIPLYVSLKMLGLPATTRHQNSPGENETENDSVSSETSSDSISPGAISASRALIDRQFQLVYLEGRPDGPFADLFSLLSDKVCLFCASQ